MAKRERVHVAWYPQWEGAIRWWTIGFIKKNSWRCDRINDPDDLLQDAYLTYAKIVKRYPRVIEPKHFMALYKVALQNEMWDRARTQQRKSQAIADIAVDAAEYGAERIGDLTNNGYLQALIAEAPDEVKFALAILTSEDATIWEEKPRQPYQKPRARENLNMKLNRAFGFRKVKFDFTGVLKTLLTKEGTT